MDSSDAVFFPDSLLCELLASSLVGLSWISSGDWDPDSIVSLVNRTNKSYSIKRKFIKTKWTEEKENMIKIMKEIIDFKNMNISCIPLKY